MRCHFPSQCSLWAKLSLSLIRHYPICGFPPLRRRSCAQPLLHEDTADLSFNGGRSPLQNASATVRATSTESCMVRVPLLGCVNCFTERTAQHSCADFYAEQEAQRIGSFQEFQGITDRQESVILRSLLTRRNSRDG